MKKLGSQNYKVYLYKYVSNTWTLTKTFYSGIINFGIARFGDSISISNDILVIGAYNWNNLGYVNIYYYINNEWVPFENQCSYVWDSLSSNEIKYQNSTLCGIEKNGIFYESYEDYYCLPRTSCSSKFGKSVSVYDKYLFVGDHYNSYSDASIYHLGDYSFENEGIIILNNLLTTTKSFSTTPVSNLITTTPVNNLILLLLVLTIIPKIILLLLR